MPYDKSILERFAIPALPLPDRLVDCSTEELNDLLRASGGVVSLEDGAGLDDLPELQRDDLIRRLSDRCPNAKDQSSVDYGIFLTMFEHGMSLKGALDTFVASERGRYAEERNHDLRWVENSMRKAKAEVEAEKGDNVKEIQQHTFTDVGNAERLAELFGGDLRYCAEQKTWFWWDERRWAKDDPTGAPMRLAKRVTRSIYAEAAEESDDDRRSGLAKWAARSDNRQRLDAMIALCRDVEPIRLQKFAAFDRDLNLLNFRNGTLDLRHGTLREHRRDNLITKLVEHNYQPKARCPQFIQFLEEAIGKDNVPFLQKCLGYSITGEVSEKKIFVCCGAKDRGKTTLLATLDDLVGDLAARISIESLLCTGRFGLSTNAQADLADLAGARLATSSEPERDGKLSSSRIKQLTQGKGSMKTCRKYENPIEFLETYKIWLDTNRPPRVEDDEATWARLVPIPFHAPKKIDRQLQAKLYAEAEGILTWLVQGARLWYAQGLGELPEEWKKAHKRWREEENKFQQFINDRCILSPDAKVTAHDLQKAQHAWAGQNGAASLNSQTLGQSLERLGCTRFRSHGGVRNWRGISVKE
jgi:putative DNA primase/helicase